MIIGRIGSDLDLSSWLDCFFFKSNRGDLTQVRSTIIASIANIQSLILNINILTDDTMILQDQALMLSSKELQVLTRGLEE
jgi:hypothetical protein